jgi:hypothetical protein
MIIGIVIFEFIFLLTLTCIFEYWDLAIAILWQFGIKGLVKLRFHQSIYICAYLLSPLMSGDAFSDDVTENKIFETDDKK